MSFKEKIATLLDALADEREANPLPEAVGLEPAPDSDSITKFASAYREVTGEDLSSELRERLEGDPALRDAVTKVAARTPQRPTPLGEATDQSNGGFDEGRPKSKEAAEREAYARFERGIMSLGER